MKSSSRITLFIIFIILLTLVGHFWWRISLFSLLPWPILLSLIIPYLTSHSWRYLLLATFIAELFSTLPPGVITTLMVIPYVLTFLPYRPETGFTLKFLGWIVVQTGIQYALLMATTLQLTFSTVVGYMALTTSLVAFGSIAVWYEAIEPYRRQRTMSRFKRR